MEQEGQSFWADIKKYEDTLDKDPNSFCFAPLSELYRKVGMVDDAINIAKRGCELHPEYVGGYMALGRAYYEKGMNAECRQSLEKVVRVTPDNLLAHRILGQIYIDAGEVAAAEESLKTILSKNPDDTESRILLNSLARSAGGGEKRAAEGKREIFLEQGIKEAEQEGNELLLIEDDGDGADVIDLLESEIVEDLTEEVEQKEDLPFIAEDDSSTPDLVADVDIGRKDPLLTVTLAELYVSQGFTERAKAIYSELLEADPANAELKNRLAALETGIQKDGANALEFSSEPDYTGFGAVDQEEAPAAAIFLQVEAGGNSPVDAQFVDEGQNPGKNEERIIHTLEIWLENIRRRRDGP